jgi:phage major head subunit gpT-like protein/phage head maturation protease
MPTTPRIEANAPTLSSLRATGTVVIEAAAGEGKRPTFTIVGYTGAPMIVGGFYTPVIVDLNGLKAARERIPILLDHDASRIVGQGTPTIDSSGVKIEGTITGDDADGGKVVMHARNGFEWQASIGAAIVRQEIVKAGEKAIVNGREVNGPILIAREARLQETSFVAIGADSQTSASVAASNPSGQALKGTAMNFEQWLQAKGFDPAALNETQKSALEAAWKAEQAPPAPAPTPAPAASPTLSAMTTFEETLKAARAEEDRKAKITQIAALVLADRPAMADEIEKLTKAAIEAKLSPTDFELSMLRAMRAPVISGPGAIDRKASVKVIEAAVCLTAGLPSPEKHFDEQTLNAASDRFRHGLGLNELLLMAARENGYTGNSTRDIRGLLNAAFTADRGIQAAGFSTFALSGILGNVANKFLLMGFMAVESGWREISSVRAVRDFKQITSYSLTGDFQYEEVGPGGELKHGTVSELSYTNQAKTYGRMFAINRTDLINDDLGALSVIPQRIGRGAALKLNDVFWTAFMNNSSFFTTARGNAIEGATVGTNDSRLGIEGLTRAETAFYNLTDADSKPLGLTAQILLVPNALNVLAAQLMNSTEVRDTTANTAIGTANPHAGKYRIVRSSYLSNSAYTGNSTTAWYILANPSELPVIEVAFLNGRDTPVVETADADFNSLGIQMRGYHDFGVSLQEYRGGLRAKGAA